MTCKIAYTEKSLTVLKKTKKVPNAKIRIKKIVDKLCLRDIKKKEDKAIYLQQKQTPCYKVL